MRGAAPVSYTHLDVYKRQVANAVRAIVVARPEGDHRRVCFVRGQTRCVVVVHDARSGLITGLRLFFPKRGWQFRPMDKVRTDRMNPAFPPALREQMVLAVVINQACLLYTSF